MTKIIPAPWLSLLLFAVWLLLQNSLANGILVLGAILAIAIPLLTRKAWPDHVRLKRPDLALIYFMRLLVDIVQANFAIAALILGRNRNLKPALVEFPLDIQADLPVTILASTISLTPGTISASVSDGRKSLLIHALNVDDPQAMIHDIKKRYESRLKEIFEC
ncbi:Na+/H+ antiporter subunit E [Idiomarina tyrosinivorans]|uniref:Na+/H+ antiporter subunit E n=1 Tax=Idiomarina tyrosinivorans TaxID=1445662 RepID=A0A432ZGZ6_9GAMM|nr:Na+/H+ antiporter subunit E [Idiomarina tyrosinivorans]